MGNPLMTAMKAASLSAREDETVETTVNGGTPWYNTTPKARGGRRGLFLVTHGPAMQVKTEFEEVLAMVESDLFDFVIGFGGSSTLPGFVGPTVLAFIRGAAVLAAQTCGKSREVAKHSTYRAFGCKFTACPNEGCDSLMTDSITASQMENNSDDMWGMSSSSRPAKLRRLLGNMEWRGGETPGSADTRAFDTSNNQCNTPAYVRMIRGHLGRCTHGEITKLNIKHKFMDTNNTTQYHTANCDNADIPRVKILGAFRSTVHPTGKLLQFTAQWYRSRISEKGDQNESWGAHTLRMVNPLNPVASFHITAMESFTPYDRSIDFRPVSTCFTLREQRPRITASLF
ncbi:uncharacterized protein EDB93DRAFT_1110171 [Suillus bovinus]|uniref:uncharacterized protein n=1 Tax=Suillus bovinus TaxID=48563 RepID=UPI001B87A246|nr:uncharacterized protein EDB93DRAFT_1110171 [Suillus bovinus]KAG2125424.1 hypothetical protein EDB93DRAFT_1110171 [Suillus bovinus]